MDSFNNSHDRRFRSVSADKEPTSPTLEKKRKRPPRFTVFFCGPTQRQQCLR
jgi:hypothetical protein